MPLKMTVISRGSTAPDHEKISAAVFWRFFFVADEFTLVTGGALYQVESKNLGNRENPGCCFLNLFFNIFFENPSTDNTLQYFWSFFQKSFD